MITPKELQNILDQINVIFSGLKDEINTLSEALGSLREDFESLRAATPKGTTKSSPKAS